MGNQEFTAEDVDAAENISEIVAAIKDEIDVLKLFVAKRDVEIVHKATKGLGTDNTALIGALCNRTKKQMKQVDMLYHETYESSLARVVTEDVGGNFGRMIRYAILNTDEYGAEVFTAATKGLGTNDHILIDLVNMYTNEQLAAIKDKWEAMNNASFLDEINDELSGSAREILLAQLMGGKSEDEEVDEDLAAEQAAQLNECGGDDAVFIEIIGLQSRAQIQAIKKVYEENYGMSLMRAVDKECRGTFKKALLACLFPSSESYTAYALFKSFEGLGTDEERVCRLLGGTDKKKLFDIASFYVETYGASLGESLKDESSGNFRKATMFWVKGNDPTAGLEYTTDIEVDEEDEDAMKDQAKALLQERENLRDFVCQVDASDIREACKGLGTGDTQLISIVCGRTKKHLARVDQYYHSMFNMSLDKQIQKECSGAYETFLRYTLMPEADFDATMLKKAMDGVGTNETLITLVLAPLTNERIIAARERHDAKFNTSLMDRLKSELNGSVEDCVMALINAERDESEEADEDLAVEQAQELHDAGIGKFMGTDKGTFIRILTTASRAQIQAIRTKYEENHDMSLEKAVKKECHGDFEDLLLALLMDPINFYAVQLKEAFKGLLTDTDTVSRILGGNDKPKVVEIADRYLERYGETLVEALKRETSGRFRRAALTWVSTADPIHDVDKLAEVFEDIPPIEEDERAPDEEINEDEEPEEEGEEEEEEEQEFTPPPPVVYYGDGGMNTAGGGMGIGPGHPQQQLYPDQTHNQQVYNQQAYNQQNLYQQPLGPYYNQPPHHHPHHPPHHHHPHHPPHHPHHLQPYHQPPPHFQPQNPYGMAPRSFVGLTEPPARAATEEEPQPIADDDDDGDEEEEEEDEEEDPDDVALEVPNATEEQAQQLHRLTRQRRRCIMNGNPHRTQQLSRRIRRLKYQIATQEL